jgi:hypothetical protein
MAAMIDHVYSMPPRPHSYADVGREPFLGKPYFLELRQLEETYAFAMDMDIQRLIKAVSASIFLPLLVVGSGGSLTVARLIVSLHQRFARMIAKPVTPLELFENSQVAPKSAIWFMSAGGRNADIQAAIRSAISNEPQRLLVTCARTSSPLAIFAGKYNYTDVFEFDLPSQRDGFLATNSLLAFSVLFVRAYLDIFNNAIPYGTEKTWSSYTETRQKQQRMIWSRNSRKQLSDRFRFQISVTSPMVGTTGWPSAERARLLLH